MNQLTHPTSVRNAAVETTVYLTQNGFEKRDWDIMFPEYSVLTEAFKGGLGWYDLTEGRGKHLLPQPKPYKVVKVTVEELKKIRAQEAAPFEAAQRIKELQQMATEDKLSENMRSTDLQNEQRQKEIQAMANEDKAAQNYELCERIIIFILDSLRKMTGKKNKDYIVDFIVNHISKLDTRIQEYCVQRICQVVENEDLIFTTPPPSPTVTPVCNDRPPSPVPQQLPPQLTNPPLEFYAFLKQPWFMYNQVMYKPFISVSGARLYVPTIYFENLKTYELPPQPIPLQQPVKIQYKETYCQMYYPLPLIPLQIMKESLPLNFKIINTITLLP